MREGRVKDIAFQNAKSSLLLKQKRVDLPQPFIYFSGPEGSRTPNLLIRSQMLYPVKLRDLIFISPTISAPAASLFYCSFLTQHLSKHTYLPHVVGLVHTAEGKLFEQCLIACFIQCTHNQGLRIEVHAL